MRKSSSLNSATRSVARVDSTLTSASISTQGSGSTADANYFSVSRTRPSVADIHPTSQPSAAKHTAHRVRSVSPTSSPPSSHRPEKPPRQLTEPDPRRISGGSDHLSAGISNKNHNKRHSGTYSDCGRHSTDWLFNGFSLRDTVKGMIHKDEKR